MIPLAIKPRMPREDDMELYQLDYALHEPCEEPGMAIHGRDTGTAWMPGVGEVGQRDPD